MVKWTNIIVHHSASEFGNARLIREWHIQRGWRDIGYHFVIQNGRPYSFLSEPIIPIIGAIEMGRPINDDSWVQGNEVGAHALGFNSNSIGICLIHLSRYLPEQLTKLLEFCLFLQEKFDIKTDRVLGHYEVDKKKPLCPGIDMNLLRGALDDENKIKVYIEHTINKEV